MVDDALPVAHNDIGWRNTHRLDQRSAGDRCRAGAIHDDLDVRELSTRYFASIYQPGCADDRSAVLVIMHDRDLHPLLERLLNDETFGRFDVLKIDPSKAGFHQCNRVDEGFGIFGVEFDIDRIHIGEPLEEYGLAFHHGLRCKRAQIAKAKNGRAI